jgi:hypothetical protein
MSHKETSICRGDSQFAWFMGNIRYNLHAGHPSLRRGMRVELRSAGVSLMRFLNDPAFWDAKRRIAILALISFLAMC